MPTWKSKICRGMDVVETITYTRQDTDNDGNLITASAVYIPSSEQENRIREEWTQTEIDEIGDRLVSDLDNELEYRKNNPITI